MEEHALFYKAKVIARTRLNFHVGPSLRDGHRRLGVTPLLETLLDPLLAVLDWDVA
jgi:hypothetical protein